MEVLICNVAAAPVRAEPAHRSEMSNQLLFGEAVEVKERKDEWLLVRSNYDDYEGWITEHLLEGFSGNWNGDSIASELLNPVFINNKKINIPMGSFLPGYNFSTKKLWKDNFRYEGKLNDRSSFISIEHLESVAKEFLHTPYLWGGKTCMGIDCSGFAQTCYKMIGIKLPRDAWQQELQGEEVSFPDVKKGDLAFFHNEKGRVTHVGLMLDAYKIIHASGKVRIDDVTEEGIIHSENGKKTHQLKSFNRYF